MEKTGKKKLFSKELRMLMYGFGDVADPMDETVDLVEELVIDYISKVTTQAAMLHMTCAQLAGNVTASATQMQAPKLTVEDITMQLTDEPKKLARVEELLFMNEEVKRVRKAY